MNADARTIVTAIQKLGSEDGQERVRARETLREIGRPVTWHLIQAVQTCEATTRHEAFQALVELADPAAAELFVENLESEDADCRWLAAEGLAALGEDGLHRALEMLLEFPRTERLRSALHHVLTRSQKPGLVEVVAPVLRAFGGAAPEMEVPTAAYEALSALRKTPHDHDTPTAR
jgi:HEAT repeats